jgi:AraC-like DNA-binding protein
MQESSALRPTDAMSLADTCLSISDKSVNALCLEPHRMTSRPKKIPIRYFSLLRDFLRQQGVDTTLLLRMAGIEEELFDERNAMLVPAQVEAFIASARRLTGRGDLGFELGCLIKMNSHDLLGYGMLSCRSVDEVMRLVVRHYHLMTETIALRYQRAGAYGEATYTPLTNMPLETLHFYYELLATAHCNQVSLILGPDAPSYDVHMSMPEPAHSARYRALAPARFHFDAGAPPGVRVIMGADLLDVALSMPNARVVQEVEERCEALGQRAPASDEGWGDLITMMLRESVGQALTLDDLAKRLSLSPRTIDRHLKNENLQFRDLSQKVRFERACELLCQPESSVSQVALSLGFSDTGNFSRAFRRVVGLSPSEYQRAASAPQPTQS